MHVVRVVVPRRGHEDTARVIGILERIFKYRGFAEVTPTHADHVGALVSGVVQSR